SAYPNPADLAIFLDEELDKSLVVEAGSGKYDTVTFNLVKQAIAKGYVEALILAVFENNPERADIRQFCARVLQQRLVLNSAAGGTDDLALKLDPSTWDMDIQAEELELFLPKQFSFEADVGALQQGLELSEAVCKITFADRPPEESGTGVLVAQDLVLTNYHVLSRQADVDLNAKARTAQFAFGYVSTQVGTSHTEVLTAAAPEPVVAASPVNEFDYALIRLSPSAEFKVKPVSLNTRAQLQPRSPLNILQHPAGEALKVSLSNNGVVKTNEAKGLVLYVNPTQRGSSGSPCFDDDWHLVALHHKNMQTSFGSVREGILLSAIHRHIKTVASVTL
ncbi:MAG: trypsin-like peptidase domain-containing protein, partial [Cyanobacteria bacterium J06559_3]